MEWTTEKPTESGYYWMKDGSAIVIVEVEIGTFDGFHRSHVWQIGTGRLTDLHKFKNMMWLGPIPDPTELKEGG